MQVDGVSNGHAYGWQKTHGKNDPDQTPEPQPANSQVVEPGGDETNGQRGVIRLLMDGHFKGVSALRLRINFHDELAAIQAAQVQALTADQADSAVAAVGEVVESFLTENELTEEQAAGLSEAQQAFEQAVSEAGEDIAAVLDNAFAAFVETLQTLFTPAATIPEEGPSLADEGGEEPETVTASEEEGGGEPEPATGPDWESFIENLQSAFGAAMDALNSTVNAATALPPLSEPNGNGVAYEKFLAIYNELWGTDPPTEELDQTEPPEPVE
ncbi:MAG: hypothetical protein ACYS9T_10110 [Planctomycetota bacterium]|jgi:hypothetical protein